MLVRERMTPDPIVVHPDTTHENALQTLREKKIRHLPVVDKQGALIGIVVEKDLLYASPSPATSLSIFEIHYLLSKLQVKDIMTKKVITVGEDCPLEEAARIMVDHKIGCLPVMRDRKAIGIITETDVFRAMAEALGGREKGLRATVQVREIKGELASLTGQIAQVGGNIMSLVVYHSGGEGHRYVTFKVKDVTQDVLVSAIGKSSAKLVEVRQVDAEYQPQIITA